MSTPNTAALRFLTGLVLGCVLGLVYGFLRPVRRGRAVLPDLLFAVIAVWVYLYYGFAVCRGDLRMGYFAAPIVGAIGWDSVFGRWLLPVYGGFWKIIDKVCRPMLRICKKFWFFLKFLFARGKKWGTIRCRKQKHRKPPSKGVPYECKKESHQTYPVDLPSQLDAGQMRGSGGYRVVYCGIGDPEDLHCSRTGKTGAAAAAAGTAAAGKLRADPKHRRARHRRKHQTDRHTAIGTGGS